MMWIEVKDGAAIEKLMSDFHGFHDSVIVSISYNSGCYVDENEVMYQMISADEHTLLMTLHSQWSKPIELLFSGVRHCNIAGFRDRYFNDLFDATLEFRTDLLGETRDDALIVWADHEGFDIKQHTERFPLESDYETTYIIANKLKYRILGEGE
ncbi:MAG: hypothetical protein K2J77_12055 [Oscillospiraceae bacterium]|nr:hypothetical protein [Oscillospiraceae bacterium]